MVNKEQIDKIIEALDGQDFILVVRAPSTSGDNQGAQLTSNIGTEAAMKVLTKFVEFYNSGDVDKRTLLNG